MAKKKSKSGGGGAGKSGRPSAQAQQQLGAVEHYLHSLPPPARVELCKQVWAGLSEEARSQLLRIELDTLRETARSVVESAEQCAEGCSWGPDPYLTEQLHIEETLEEALARLKERGTWKVWVDWESGQEFYDAESFRQHVVVSHLPEDLRALVPPMDPKAVETAQEAGLRSRMSDLLERITGKHAQLRSAEGPCGGPGGLPGPWGGPSGGGRRRGPRQTTEQLYASMKEFELETITMIAQALAQEHELIHEMVLAPVTAFVIEALEEDAEVSRTEASGSLHFEDLDRLAPEQVARICEWLTEKVDSLCAQLKPDVLEGPGVNGSSSGGSGSGSSAPEGAAGPEAVGASGSTGSTEGVQQAQPQQAGAVASTGGGNEREEMGDIDLWSLSADGASLEVNPKWLGHLRARLLGDDGHPRKAGEGEDAAQSGLVLEWVYGCIVSTAEKARDAAQRALGSEPPSAGEAFERLVAALRQQATWVGLAESARAHGAALREAARGLVHACTSHGIAPPTPVVLAAAAPAPAPAPAPAATSGAAGATAAASSEPGQQPGDMAASGTRSTSGATSSCASQAAPAEAAPALHAMPTLPLLPPPMGSASGPAVQLPREVLMALMALERAQAAAKAALLEYERLAGERALRSLAFELRVAEPELHRLRRRMDSSNGAGSTPARGGSAQQGSVPSQAERLEALARQMCNQGARMAALHEKRRQEEQELARRLAEGRHMQAWAAALGDIQSTISAHVASLSASKAIAGGHDSNRPGDTDAQHAQHDAGAEALGLGLGLGDLGMGMTSCCCHTQPIDLPSLLTKEQLLKLDLLQRKYWQQPQKGGATAAAAKAAKAAAAAAAGEEEGAAAAPAAGAVTPLGPDVPQLASKLEAMAAAVAQELADASAALCHCEMAIINVACNDPGASVGLQLLLPVLQQRLDAEVAAAQEARAQEAVAALIQEEAAEKAKSQAAAAAAAAAAARSKSAKAQAAKRAGQAAGRNAQAKAGSKQGGQQEEGAAHAELAISSEASPEQGLGRAAEAQKVEEHVDGISTAWLNEAARRSTEEASTSAAVHAPAAAVAAAAAAAAGKQEGQGASSAPAAGSSSTASQQSRTAANGSSATAQAASRQVGAGGASGGQSTGSQSSQKKDVSAGKAGMSATQPAGAYVGEAAVGSSLAQIPLQGQAQPQPKGASAAAIVAASSSAPPAPSKQPQQARKQQAGAEAIRAAVAGSGSSQRSSGEWVNGTGKAATAAAKAQAAPAVAAAPSAVSTTSGAVAAAAGSAKRAGAQEGQQQGGKQAGGLSAQQQPEPRALEPVQAPSPRPATDPGSPSIHMGGQGNGGSLSRKQQQQQQAQAAAAAAAANGHSNGHASAPNAAVGSAGAAPYFSYFASFDPAAAHHQAQPGSPRPQLFPPHMPSNGTPTNGFHSSTPAEPAQGTPQGGSPQPHQQPHLLQHQQQHQPFLPPMGLPLTSLQLPRPPLPPFPHMGFHSPLMGGPRVGMGMGHGALGDPLPHAMHGLHSAMRPGPGGLLSPHDMMLMGAGSPGPFHPSPHHGPGGAAAAGATGSTLNPQAPAFEALPSSTLHGSLLKDLGIEEDEEPATPAAASAVSASSSAGSLSASASSAAAAAGAGAGAAARQAATPPPAPSSATAAAAVAAAAAPVAVSKPGPLSTSSAGAGAWGPAAGQASGPAGAAGAPAAAPPPTGMPGAGGLHSLWPTPPTLFLCPLTRGLLREPVVAADGLVYERQAIAQWLAGSSVSPVTGQQLEDARLLPVLPLRAAVHEWAAAHGVPL